MLRGERIAKHEARSPGENPLKKAWAPFFGRGLFKNVRRVSRRTQLLFIKYRRSNERRLERISYRLSNEEDFEKFGHRGVGGGGMVPLGANAVCQAVLVLIKIRPPPRRLPS